MKKKIACFGDAHGALDSLVELYSMLCWESLDELWHLGDLIDRGPDSEGVVAFCREFGIKGIMGNHEGAMLEKFIKNKTPPSGVVFRVKIKLDNRFLTGSIIALPTEALFLLALIRISFFLSFLGLLSKIRLFSIFF